MLRVFIFMQANYNLTQYRADLSLAEIRYTEVIRSYCVSNGAVLPLDEQDIYHVLATARGHKNQIVSAAGKRLRAGVALRLLDGLQGGLDLTATLAARITERLLGRAISRAVLLARYGTKHRTAGDKSPDFARLDEIAASPLFLAAVAELQTLLAAAENMREQVKVEQLQGGPTEAQRLLADSAKVHQ